jgi:hypothetical protein
LGFGGVCCLVQLWLAHLEIAREPQEESMSAPHQQFLRAATIARNIDLKLDTVRRQVKRGVFGEPRFLNGEWCAPRDGYEAWLEAGKTAPVPHDNQLAQLKQFAKGSREKG